MCLSHLTSEPELTCSQQMRGIHSALSDDGSFPCFLFYIFTLQLLPAAATLSKFIPRVGLDKPEEFVQAFGRFRLANGPGSRPEELASRVFKTSQDGALRFAGSH